MVILAYLEKNGYTSYYKNNVPDRNENIAYISLQLGLKLMSNAGFPIDKPRTTVKEILKFTTIFTNFLLTILIIAKAFENINDLQKLSDIAASFNIMCLCFSKSVTTILKYDILCDLNKFTNRFWRIEDEPDNMFYEYCNSYANRNKIFRGFILACIISIILMLTNQFSGKMTFTVWIPENSVWSLWIVNVIVTVFILTNASVVLGFDIYFVAICFNLKQQFILLKLKMQDIDFELTRTEKRSEVEEKLKKILEHHTFLLDYASQMKTAYSMMFLVQYFVTLFQNCCESVVLLFGPALHFSNLVLPVTAMYVTIIQIALYCFPLAQITDEAADVMQAIFNTNWHASDPKIRKNLLIMQMRCQRDCNFTAGGFVTMNHKTFGLLFRTVFSFITLVNSLKDN